MARKGDGTAVLVYYSKAFSYSDGILDMHAQAEREAVGLSRVRGKHRRLSFTPEI
jgi:hypothetical protein